MRFKTDLKNIRTFSKFSAALSSVEKITWARFDNDTARFTVIPDSGSQVWASLAVDLIFENYNIQSAEDNNTINFELPLQPLQRALRSALNSVAASLRLTKKDGMPVLSLTVTTTTNPSGGGGGGGGGGARRGAPNGTTSAAAANQSTTSTTTGGGSNDDDPFDDGDFSMAGIDDHHDRLETSLRREHEKVITQDIPVRVLHPDSLSFMQPRVREADVHIQLPPLLQLKAISDRFTRLALSPHTSSSLYSSASATGSSALLLNPASSQYPAPFAAATASTSAAVLSLSSAQPRLELSANMHGQLRIRVSASHVGVLTSSWRGLSNPELDPAQLDQPAAQHPSEAFRAAGPGKWATVRVDGRDWSKVLSVGRLEGRVIACFADEHALILYVYVPHYDNGAEDESVITYYVQSYSA